MGSACEIEVETGCLASQFLPLLARPCAQQEQQGHARGQIGWFSLPREIRDQVMSEIFAPGEAHVPATRAPSKTKAFHRVIRRVANDCVVQGFRKHHAEYRDKQKLPLRLIKNCKTVYAESLEKDKNLPIRKLPGLQFLATCKQVHEEGLQLFYSSNTFFLPPGPIELTFNHFNEKLLSRQHLCLIRNITIVLGLQDLTPAVFDDCQRDMTEYMSLHAAGMPRRAFADRNRRYLRMPYLGRVWGTVVEIRLRRTWVRKIAVLHSSNPRNCLRIVLGDEVLALEGFGDRREGCRWLCLQEVQEMLDKATRLVKAEVAGRVNLLGWTGTRVWVRKGGWQMSR